MKTIINKISNFIKADKDKYSRLWESLSAKKGISEKLKLLLFGLLVSQGVVVLLYIGYRLSQRTIFIDNVNSLINENLLINQGNIIRIYNKFLFRNVTFLILFSLELSVSGLILYLCFLLLLKFFRRFRFKIIAKSPYEKRLTYNLTKETTLLFNKVTKRFSIVFVIAYAVLIIFLVWKLLITKTIKHDEIINISAYLGLTYVILLSIIHAIIVNKRFYKIKKRRIIIFRNAFASTLSLMNVFLYFIIIIYFFGPIIIGLFNYHSNKYFIANRTAIFETQIETYILTNYKNTNEVITRINFPEVKNPSINPNEFFSNMNKATKYIPLLILFIVLYTVIIPSIIYSKRQSLIGFISLLLGILITYFSNFILPKLFHWTENMIIAVIPMVIVTYALTMFVSLYISSDKC